MAVTNSNLDIFPFVRRIIKFDCMQVEFQNVRQFWGFRSSEMWHGTSRQEIEILQLSKT